MPYGTEIHACISGKAQVIDSGSSGLGLHVIITNGKYKTVYGHCSKVYVTNGEQISVGSVVAEVGSTGNSTGPHLHLEYYINGVQKNPKVYLKSVK